MSFVNEFVRPAWPQPKTVQALCTTREYRAQKGGESGDFNLALHVNDDSEKVLRNRRYLLDAADISTEPLWLNQVHGSKVVCAYDLGQDRQADASYADQADCVCVVQTADCLPVLFCNQQGTWVAAAHAGWRGMHAGILQETLKHYRGDRADLLAWLGPAIGPKVYEVGEEVYQVFIDQDVKNNAYFLASGTNHWYMNLYGIATGILQGLGVTGIYGGDYCTYTDAELFYSYRREGVTGRMANLIWLTS